MNPTDASYKMPMDKPEMEYLVKKKNEGVASQFKVLRFLIAVIIIISVAAGIGLFIVMKISPEIFDNANTHPDILLTCLKLMLGLTCVVIAGTYYGYYKTLRKVIIDIRNGEKTIEPCIVIRKVCASENNTCHVFITSNIRISIEVIMDEYNLLQEGDKINIAYSSCSKIFFGYTIMNK
jgi:hypothetical protein